MHKVNGFHIITTLDTIQHRVGWNENTRGYDYMTQGHSRNLPEERAICFWVDCLNRTMKYELNQIEEETPAKRDCGRLVVAVGVLGARLDYRLVDYLWWRAAEEFGRTDRLDTWHDYILPLVLSEAQATTYDDIRRSLELRRYAQ